MNKTELAEILTLAEKANLPYKFTPGDWDCERECGHKCGDPPCGKEEECEHMRQITPADVTKIFTVDCGDFMGLGDDTAAYIVAACNTAPTLARDYLALVERRERLERIIQLQAEIISVSDRLASLGHTLESAYEFECAGVDELQEEFDGLQTRQTELRKLLAEGVDK